MKYYISLGLIVFGLFYLYEIGAIFREFRSVSANEAFEMMQNDKQIVVLDVRNKKEYESKGRIKGAIWISFQELKKDLSKLEEHKGKNILVYCSRGRRSVAVSKTLQNAGFKPINLKDGMNGWIKHGYDVEKSDMSQGF